MRVNIHPRYPYGRIDALRRNRHIVVAFEGVELDNTRSGVILYETGHVPRHYLPPTDVCLDMLSVSDQVTHCPYKRSTVYYDLDTNDRDERDRVELSHTVS